MGVAWTVTPYIKENDMLVKNDCLLENWYGAHQGAAFCEKYYGDLVACGCKDKADIILAAYDNYTTAEDHGMSGLDCDLQERARDAWEDIVYGEGKVDGLPIGYEDDGSVWNYIEKEVKGIYRVNVMDSDNKVIESLGFTYKEEAESVAEAIENLTDYYVSVEEN